MPKYSLYQRRVKDFLKPMGTSKGQITHMALGISGEAGEVVDLLKKHVIYGKPLDRSKLEEELGDILFYCYNLANTLNIDMKAVKAANIKKLAKRYPNGYSNKDAIKRRDKV